jgi:pyrroloquinoline quinone biosynthesis protein B
MRIRILGSAAGGGLPQWNCGCPNCRAARSGAPNVRPRSQSSVAVSADGRGWFLLNVSADVRMQLAGCPDLWPPASAIRSTPIAGCVLTDAEIDHASGLLQLREGCAFPIYSTAAVRAWLHQCLPLGPILTSFAERPWSALSLETPFELPLSDSSASGLRVTLFELGREAPRFVPQDTAEAPGACVGLVVEDNKTGGKLVYAPGVPAIGESLEGAARGAQCLLVDGTFWSDREGIEMGITELTARGMGHVSIDGPDGSLAWLGRLDCPHRMYVHMNNTNSILNDLSAERRQVEAAGVRVAMDGDCFDF